MPTRSRTTAPVEKAKISKKKAGAPAHGLSVDTSTPRVSSRRPKPETASDIPARDLTARDVVYARRPKIQIYRWKKHAEALGFVGKSWFGDWAAKVLDESMSRDISDDSLHLQALQTIKRQLDVLTSAEIMIYERVGQFVKLFMDSWEMDPNLSPQELEIIKRSTDRRFHEFERIGFAQATSESSSSIAALLTAIAVRSGSDARSLYNGLNVVGSLPFQEGGGDEFGDAFDAGGYAEEEV